MVTNYTNNRQKLKLIVTLFFSCVTFVSEAQTLVTFAGKATAGFKDSTGIYAEFNGPNGIAIDKVGNIFITDQGNNCIRKITPDSVVTTVAGNGIAGFADGPGTTAEFNVPTRIAVDANDNLYVADEGNQRIRKITSKGVVSTLAGNGIAGYADGPGANAEFSYPDGVAVDTSGNVYVADQLNNLVRKITPGGVVSTYAGNGAFDHTVSLAVDLKGNVYVSDWLHYRICKITPDGIISTLAGNGVAGFRDGPGANAEFGNGAMRVSVDTSRNVYVADPGNFRLRKITPGGVVSTLAGSGIKGYLDTLAMYSQFSNITGAAIAPDGNIFITDFSNNVIRELTSASGGPLPVTFLNFTAEFKNNDGLLSWQTATEENSNYFNIERSSDGSHFNIIGSVPASGNSSITKSYNYTDVKAATLNASALYYRLQEVDKDGKSITSKIQLLNLIKKLSITVTPNPVIDFINITSSADVKNARISLIDISGKKYYARVQNLFAGMRLQIPVSKNYAVGTYFVQIIDASGKTICVQEIIKN